IKIPKPCAGQRFSRLSFSDDLFGRSQRLAETLQLLGQLLQVEFTEIRVLEINHLVAFCGSVALKYQTSSHRDKLLRFLDPAHEIALSALSSRCKTFSFPKIATKWYRLGPAGFPQIASRVGCTSTPVFTPNSFATAPNVAPTLSCSNDSSFA